MNRKIAVLALLSLISFNPIIRTDFLDLCGSLLWHIEGETIENFCVMFNKARSSNSFSCIENFDVNLRLKSNNSEH